MKRTEAPSYESPRRRAIGRTTPAARRRREYRRAALDRADLAADPIAQFRRWFRDALAAQVIEPHAMTLATAGADGRPSARIVLLKSFDRRGFVFATHYGSRKAREMLENPRAALVLYWPPLERQVRVRGAVSRVSRAESRAIFRARPRASRLAAWVSPQSEVLADRETLEAAHRRAAERFRGRDVPLPPFWGGFRLRPTRIEFWQGRPHRLHDRFEYTRTPSGAWRIARLAP